MLSVEIPMPQTCWEASDVLRRICWINDDGIFRLIVADQVCIVVGRANP